MDSGSVKPMRDARRWWIALTLGILVALSSGAAWGFYAQRWGPSELLLVTAEHLKSFPIELGAWQVQTEEPIDPATIEMLNCSGYINRSYVNRETGETVRMAIFAGPPGPIAVHTPEICYSSRDYAQEGKREAVPLKDPQLGKHSVWKVAFQANGPFADKLVVAYAWSDGGYWNASEAPRFQYAGTPALMKIQIAGLAASEAGSPTIEFMKALVQSDWSASKAAKSVGK